MSKYISVFWIAITVVIFGALFLLLFPKMVDKWGLVPALLLSPLFLVAAALAYIRGYWVSRWLARGSGRPASRR